MEYDLISKQLENLIETEPFYVPALSNAAAIMWEELEDINWAGFYIVRDEKLVLGPFQGKVACIHIAPGKGVCGTAWEKDEALVVPDVHEFKGHIACDSASRSEIVIPIHSDGKVVAVLDIDSPNVGRFSAEDKSGLEVFAKVIEKNLLWE